jgi:long-chain acyl-CoA synthetase
MVKKKSILDFIDINKISNFSDILTVSAEVYGERIFIEELNSRKITYLNFNNTVNKCCNYFKYVGLDVGDVVSILIKNRIEFLILYFSAIRSGIIVNPIPVHVSSPDVIRIANSVQSKVIFVDGAPSEKLTSLNQNIINIDLFKDGFMESLIKYSSFFSNCDLNKDSTAVYYASSGTTGEQKIICYSHKAMIASQFSMLRSGFSEDNSVALCFLPLGHTASLRYIIKQSFLTGSKVILCESFLKIRHKLWDIVHSYRINFFQVVPSIVVTILNTSYKDFDKGQIETLNFIGCGSSYLPETLQIKFEEKFEVPLSNLYGLSETGATHFDNPFIANRTYGNIGRPFDIYDVIILNNNKVCNPEEVGEIAIKGDGLFDGYLNNKLEDNLYFNGYFLTGDLGKFDDNGIFYYLERKKDLIIKAGINILPSSIDEFLISCDEIIECATIGVPDVMYGEKIVSYIVTNSEINISNLTKKCQIELGILKTPSNFITVDVLPKGPSGKILKRKLKDDYLSENI